MKEAALVNPEASQTSKLAITFSAFVFAGIGVWVFSIINRVNASAASAAHKTLLLECLKQERNNVLLREPMSFKIHDGDACRSFSAEVLSNTGLKVAEADARDWLFAASISNTKTAYLIVKADGSYFVGPKPVAAVKASP